MLRLRLSMVAAALTLAAAGCAGEGDGEHDRGPATATAQEELDTVGLAQTPASLLVLAPTADRAALRDRLEALGGGVVAELPPRLVIAQVPAGADGIARDLGVVARFDRPVEAGEIADATLDEDRFAAVYANRWFAQVPGPMRLAPRRMARVKGETFEAEPRHGHTVKGIVPPGGPAPDPEDQVSVPYASGTIVVSIVLPESNGSIDPSTEDWNEQSIRETYLKVQASLDTFVAADPNNKLRYILHFESAPADGGLPGTVDTGYEFGQRAQWNDWTRESEATAAVLGRIMGRTIEPNDVFAAALDYDRQLRDRYHADGAFFVIVAANQNYTASLRAHAYINGPWTVLDSSYGWETFMHEFGHIHGANDEYCPDACAPPNSLQGYFGIYNANATYRQGDTSTGINNGMGENEPSLMMYNDPTNINGYTRASWGWLDLDGDGVVDVRDTTPQSALSVTTVGQTVHVTGTIVDQPATRLWGTKYSVNRITALEYRIGHAPVAPWFSAPLAGDTRGRQAVDLDLLQLPVGSYELWTRAVNSVGNREVPKLTMITIDGTDNAAPRVRLDLDHSRASLGATVTATAVAVDNDADTLAFRFDTDGDGAYDTAWSASNTLTFAASRAGIRTIGVAVRDGRGHEVATTASLPVFDADAPAALTMSAVPSLVHGADTVDLAATATATDADGGALSYQWTIDSATSNYPTHVESAWSASPDFVAHLETPKSLVGRRLDLSGGEPTLVSGEVRQFLALDANTIAVAGGTRGVWFVDITDRGKPTLISRIDLETPAFRLYRDGSRLWVLGTALTAIDIRDLRAPREIKQLLATTGKRTAIGADEYAIPEAEGLVQEFMYLDGGERITDSRVLVTLDHPRLSDLTITLYPPKGQGPGPIVLWDHKSAGGGRRTLNFTTGNTPALRGLNGMFAADGWQVTVQDDQANGLTGTLYSAELRFSTSTRAATVLPGATQIVGFTGRNIIIAGEGLQLLDTSIPQWVLATGAIKGTGAVGAAKVGSKVVWYGALEMKSKDGTILTPALRGLAAIDISVPFAPRLVRAVTDLGGNAAELAMVGSRMYVRVAPEKVDCGRGCTPNPIFTVVGNPTTFVANGRNWQLGTTLLRVDPTAFGDDQKLWTLNDQGAVAQLDVHAPAAITTLASYARTFGGGLVPLGGPEVVLFQWSTESTVVRLDQTTSTVSRAFRLTVAARDTAGNTTRAARTVHVIPYDHAPMVQSAEVVQGVTTNDTWIIRVTLTDADSAAGWDPTQTVRVDWDGDGAWDSDWTYASGGVADVYASFPEAGHRNAIIQVRDGFFATATTTLAFDVLPITR